MSTEFNKDLVCKWSDDPNPNVELWDRSTVSNPLTTTSPSTVGSFNRALAAACHQPPRHFDDLAPFIKSLLTDDVLMSVPRSSGTFNKDRTGQELVYWLSHQFDSSVKASIDSFEVTLRASTGVPTLSTGLASICKDVLGRNEFKTSKVINGILQDEYSKAQQSGGESVGGNGRTRVPLDRVRERLHAHVDRVMPRIQEWSTVFAAADAGKRAMK